MTDNSETPDEPDYAPEGGSWPMPASLAAVLLFTPLCLLFIPGFLLLHVYGILTKKPDNWVYQSHPDDWISGHLKVFIWSLVFWVLISSICILIWG